MGSWEEIKVPEHNPASGGKGACKCVSGQRSRVTALTVHDAWQVSHYREQAAGGTCAACSIQRCAYLLMCGASSSSFTRATVRAGESAWGRCSLMRASTRALARRRMQRLKQVATGRV